MIALFFLHDSYLYGTDALQHIVVQRVERHWVEVYADRLVGIEQLVPNAPIELIVRIEFQALHGIMYRDWRL